MSFRTTFLSSLCFGRDLMTGHMTLHVICVPGNPDHVLSVFRKPDRPDVVGRRSDILLTLPSVSVETANKCIKYKIGNYCSHRSPI